MEHIDIGGVTLLRAAAKNFAYVTVVARPEDYPACLYELEATGATSMETRRRLATIAFQHTALYDTAIAELPARRDSAEEAHAGRIHYWAAKARTLRYGENPHQQAALYSWGGHGYGV